MRVVLRVRCGGSSGDAAAALLMARGGLAALRCDGARELPLSDPSGWARRYATATCSNGERLPSDTPSPSLAMDGGAEVRASDSGFACGAAPLQVDGSRTSTRGCRPFCTTLAKLPSRRCHAGAQALPASDGAAELYSPPASASDCLLVDPLRVAAGADASEDRSSSSFSSVSRDRALLPAPAALACCSVGPKASPFCSAGLDAAGCSACG